ncbi:MAG: DedA family protein [bacterium]|nr:DedA family protein [bacterium]
MITDLLIAITGFVTSTIDALGYMGVTVLMAIESAAIPLPSEIIMPFSGSLVSANRFTLIGLGIAGATGSVIGSVVTYALGFYGGRKLILKYGHFFLISEKDLELTENFFARFGSLSSFLGRLIPIVRTFISIPAGIGKVPLTPFILYTFIGSFIWSYFLAWVGLKLGENWHTFEAYFRRFDIFFVAVIASFIIYWIRKHLKNRV